MTEQEISNRLFWSFSAAIGMCLLIGMSGGIVGSWLMARRFESFAEKATRENVEIKSSCEKANAQAQNLKWAIEAIVATISGQHETERKK